MSSNLHPVMAAALAPWTPPPRTAEEEARYIAADVAIARERVHPDFEQHRADRIERLDAAAVRGFNTILPGAPK